MDLEVGYGAAAVAGLLSFLSPCILPIVPFYLCYLAGISYDTLTQSDGQAQRSKSHVIVSSIMFAVGVTLVFVAMGASATAIGQQFREWFDVLKYAAAALIFLMGLHFLHILRISLLYREARLDAGERRWGVIGALLIGMAFAFGWTPCVGPILAAILFTASGADSASQGALLLLSYALGMTLPFVLAAVFIGPFLAWAARFRRHMQWIERVMGGLLIVFSVMIATDSMNIVAGWLLQIAPDIGTLQ
jgi:cytochrome c-type biogenesis protein